jgi:hypothetical protein
LTATGALKMARGALEQHGQGAAPVGTAPLDHRRRRLLWVPGDVVLATCGAAEVELKLGKLVELGYQRGHAVDVLGELRSAW